jgi:hypothetical protein
MSGKAEDLSQPRLPNREINRNRIAPIPKAVSFACTPTVTQGGLAYLYLHSGPTRQSDAASAHPQPDALRDDPNSGWRFKGHIPDDLKHTERTHPLNHAGEAQIKCHCRVESPRSAEPKRAAPCLDALSLLVVPTLNNHRRLNVAALLRKQDVEQSKQAQERPQPGWLVPDSIHDSFKHHTVGVCGPY